MPVYKTTTTLPDQSHASGKVTVTRLVDAPNVAAARSFVAKEIITVEVCGAAEAVELGGKGIKLERAGNGA